MVPEGRPATLTVICGPMFAGKTTALREAVEAARAAGLRVAVVKPARDTRYAADAVVTHTGERTEAHAVRSLDEALALEADLVAVDEVHFFAGEAVAPIDALLARGTSVVVAGCDIDHFGGVFAPFDALLPRAHSVRRIAGTCVRCGAPSTHSERLVPITDRIIVGGIGDFVATCAACFRPCARP
jgi:thymidine kinase